MNTEFSNIKSKNNNSPIIYGCYPDYDMVRLKVNSRSFNFSHPFYII